MKLATTKGGEVRAVRYDCRGAVDPETHRATAGGSVRCWGRLVRTRRDGGLVFLAGDEITLTAEDCTVEEVPRTAAQIRRLTLAPGSSWRGV